MKRSTLSAEKVLMSTVVRPDRHPKRNPKAKMLYLQSFLRKGVSLGYVGRIKT